MKKILTILLALLLLVGTLAACTEAPEPEAAESPAPVEPETPELEVIEGPGLMEADTPDPTPDESTQQEPPTSYTIEQIQIAMQPQFQVGDWGEGNPQVISAQRVERDRDSMWFEPGATYIDLSNSLRYRVAARFRQPIEDYNMWAEIYADWDESPFSRDGDYTILTGYYYFNDVNGTPELAFVLC